jgi:membrane-bound lytic murein transglycosylase F
MAKIPTTYDALIQASTQKHLPGVDWRLLKAQFWQESRFNPKAVSPAGAKGITQFMPATWAEVVKRLKWPFDADIFDPKLSIEAGAFDMKLMRAVWVGCDNVIDQHKLACASYNAGAGNIRRASREAGSDKADAVLAALPKITRIHAKETQTYVRKIYEYYGQLSADAIPAKEKP